MKFLLLAAFVGLALAGDDYKANDYKKVEKVEYGYEKRYDSKGSGKGYDKGYGYQSKQVYHGKYPGKCSNDGFYYNDEYSFMICSNGNSYQQKCAPGSKNSGHKNYEYGKDYYYHDFCDVNLVDHGYAVHHGDNYGQQDNYGYGHRDSYRGDSHQGYGSYGHGDNYGYRDNGYNGDSHGRYGRDYRYDGPGYRGGYRAY